MEIKWLKENTRFLSPGTCMGIKVRCPLEGLKATFTINPKPQRGGSAALRSACTLQRNRNSDQRLPWFQKVRWELLKTKGPGDM